MRISENELRALSRELGTIGLIRFLQMFETGEGDYSEERHSLLASETAAEVAAKIERRLDSRR